MTAPILVLVVDDEPPIRKLLRLGLSAQGYDVLDAPNGKTALELLAKNPNLIILDLGLPDIDGLDLLRRIRQRQEGVAGGDGQADEPNGAQERMDRGHEYPGVAQAWCARRKRKNSAPSRSRRRVISQLVSISRTISQIFDGRK